MDVASNNTGLKNRLMVKHPVLVIIFAAILASCTERIEINLDSTYTRMVVYGEITSDSLRHGIYLSKTADYFSNSPVPVVSGAVVSISSGDSVYNFSEDPDEPGLYLPERAFRGLPGNTYHLSITGIDINDDGTNEEYEAESKMPVLVTLDSIWVLPFASGYFSGHQVQLFAMDPAATKEYYNYRIMRNGVMITDTLIEFISQSDDFFNGNYLYALPVTFLNDEDPEEAVGAGDIVTLEMASIPEGYYNFLSDARSEIFGSVPLFSGPPANVSTNLSSGALGYFVAYAVSRKSQVVFL